MLDDFGRSMLQGTAKIAMANQSSPKRLIDLLVGEDKYFSQAGLADQMTVYGYFTKPVKGKAKRAKKPKTTQVSTPTFDTSGSIHALWNRQYDENGTTV